MSYTFSKYFRMGNILNYKNRKEQLTKYNNEVLRPFSQKVNNMNKTERTIEENAQNAYDTFNNIDKKDINYKKAWDTFN